MNGIRQLLFQRVWFGDHDEAEFIRLMGGRVSMFEKLPWSDLQDPLIMVWSFGSVLRHEQFRRDVRVGDYVVNFGNDVQRAIKFDHENRIDIVADQAFDDYLRDEGWAVIHVKTRHLYSEPDVVKTRVFRFLNY